MGGRKKMKGVGGGRLLLVILPLVLVSLVVWMSFVDRLRFVSAYYKVALVGDNQIRVVAVNPVEQRGAEVVIPGNLLVPVVGMEGELRAESLWQFGEGEGEPEEVVGRSLEWLLGIKIDGVWKDRGDTGLDWKDAWLAKDDGWLRRLMFVREWKGLRPDQIISTGLSSRGVSTEMLPDGEEVIRFDRKLVEGWASKLYMNRVLYEDNAALRVVNASGVEGLGWLMEAMMENDGGLVVEVKSGEEVDGGCVVRVTDTSKRMATVDWLKSHYGCSLEKEDVGGDVVVTVGKDWGEDYRR